MDELAEIVIRLVFDDDDLTSGAASAGQSLQKTAASFTSVAQTVTKTVTAAFTAAAAAVAGVGTAAAVIGSNFERQISVVGAIAGATGADLRDLEDAARDLGATTTFSATQAAEAFENFARAGFGVGESIAAAGPALALAQASASSLDQAAASVVATLSQFGLGAEDAGRAADVLANAAASTQFSLEGLTASLRQAGPAGASIGLSLEETVATLSQFRNLGLEAGQAGTIFRSAITSLVNPSDEARRAIEDLGLSLADVDVSQVAPAVALQRLRDAGLAAGDASTIFGRFGLQVLAVANNIDDASTGVAFLNQRLQETGVAAAIAEQATNNVAGRFAILRSAVEESLLSLFDAFRGPLTSLLNEIIPVIGTISQEIQRVSAQIQDNLARTLVDLQAIFSGSGAQAARVFADALVFVVAQIRFLVAAVRTLQSLFTSFTSTVSSLAGGFRSLAIDALGPVVDALIGAERVVDTVTASVQNTIDTIATLIGLVTGVSLFGALIGEVQELAEEADRAAQALESLGQTFERERGTLQQDIASGRSVEELTTATRDFVTAQQARIDAGQVLTRQQQNELASLQRLVEAANAAPDQLIPPDALAGLDTGKLVEVNGVLRTTQAALAETGDTAGVVGESFNRSVASLRGDATQAISAAESLRAKIEEVQAQASGDDQAQAEFVRQLEEAATLEEGRAARALSAIDSLRQAEQQAQLDRNQAVADAAAERTRIEQNEAKSRTTAQEQETARQVKAVEAALKSIGDAVDAAQAQSTDLFLSDPAAVRQAADQSVAAIQAGLAEVLNSQVASDQQRAAAAAAAEEAILQIRGNAARELVGLAQEAQNQLTAAEQAREESRLSFLQQTLTEEQQLRQQAAAVVLALDKAVADQRLAVEEQFQAALAAATTAGDVVAANRARAAALTQIDRDLAGDREDIEVALQDRLGRIAAQASADRARDAAAAFSAFDDVQLLPEEEVARTNKFFDDLQQQPGAFGRVFSRSLEGARSQLLETFGPKTIQLFSDIGKAGVAAINTIRQGLEAAQSGVRALTGVVDTVLGGFVSGFNVQGIVQEVTDAVAEAEAAVAQARTARDEAAAGGDPAALASAQAELATAQAALLTAQQGASTGETSTGIVDELVNGALAFAENLSANLDAILNSLIERLPELLAQAGETIGNVLNTLGERLPELLQTVIDSSQTVIDGIVDNLPAIVQAIAESIGPSLIEAISGIGQIISAIVEQIPVVVQELFAALPAVLTQLASSIGGIIASIATAIPGIIEGVLTAIPDIITSLLGAISTIIEAVINAIPVIITGIVQAIPNIITAVLESIPTLIETLLSSIPTIIFALISAIPTITKSLLLELPKLTIQAVVGFIREIPRIVSSFFTEFLPNLFRSIGEAVTNLFSSIGPKARELFKNLGNIILNILTGGILGAAKNRKERQEEIERSEARLLRAREEGNRRDIRAAEQQLELADEARKGGFLGLGRLFRRIFRRGEFEDTESRLGAQGGIDFMSRTAQTIIHPGEAVLTAQQNRERLFGTRGRQNPVSSFGGRGGPAPRAAAAGMGPIQLNVNVGGRTWDRFQVESDARGDMNLTDRRNRRKSGSRVGFEKRKK